MKICVTSQGDSLDSVVDPRFGRCQYFIIVDIDSLEFETVQNPGIAAGGGAGIQSAQLVANKDVEVILTGNVGPNAYQTLQAAGVKIIVGATGTVREAIEQYKKGGFTSSTGGPNVSAHFGMQPQPSASGDQITPGATQGPTPDMGTGMGMGRGGGKGMGMGRGMDFQQPSYQQPVSKEQELKILKNQANALQEQLNQLLGKIKEIED